ncbi:unnamed protein product [Vitrella brassicaformis CCMP3155]|uniref:ER lumen protein-retaining receptor n=2 Tax=Vitrella brassicaformis TaxID=1169539 RepID=A0A0G4GV63_VITBC|nr:unnamed protein product [Vitrella brassicaformis CCMP3155]|eukprot:CEM34761.1 unnamed protein product [Vitrella brassicaformis CCMP3155]
MRINTFRFAGDMLHLFSIVLLIWKLMKSKNCVGVSCRMQEVYAILFCFRYLDIFWNFVSLYNSVLKVVFLTGTFYLIYLMRFKPPIKETYDRKADSFSYEKYLLIPACVLGFITAEEWTIPEILWTSSIWLEAGAIMPQLMLLQQLGEVENLTAEFVVTMGLYRAFYILNWVYRFYFESYVNVVGWIAGVIQTALYLDFFYYYAMSKWYGQKLVLPFAEV